MEKHFYESLIHFDFSQDAVLCAVLEWKGSVPRKDYPMMLVTESGKILNTIGGGEMENEVIQTAKSLMETGETKLKEFDFTNDDCTVPGGMCGGTIQILMEPFTPQLQSFWKSLNFNNNNQGNSFMLIQFDTRKEKSVRFYLRDTATPDGLPDIVKNKLNGSLNIKTRFSFRVGGSKYFIHPIIPPSLLHIFGGGHIGKAVADLAHFIDLDIYVYDDRKDFTTPERFPHAELLINKPLESYESEPPLPSNDIALIATRGHEQDIRLMRWLLKSPPAWLGMISSSRKWKIISETLLKEGLSKNVINHVKAPVGLDIHADTVPEIAVSIVGDIIRHLRKNNSKN